MKKQQKKTNDSNEFDRKSYIQKIRSFNVKFINEQYINNLIKFVSSTHVSALLHLSNCFQSLKMALQSYDNFYRDNIDVLPESIKKQYLQKNTLNSYFNNGAKFEKIKIYQLCQALEFKFLFYNDQLVQNQKFQRFSKSTQKVSVQCKILQILLPHVQILKQTILQLRFMTDYLKNSDNSKLIQQIIDKHNNKLKKLREKLKNLRENKQIQEQKKDKDFYKKQFLVLEALKQNKIDKKSQIKLGDQYFQYRQVQDIILFQEKFNYHAQIVDNKCPLSWDKKNRAQFDYYLRNYKTVKCLGLKGQNKENQNVIVSK